MDVIPKWLHRAVGIWGLGTSALMFRETLFASERIRPFTSMGWRQEQAELGLSFLLPAALVIASAASRPTATKAWSALFLGIVALLAYKRYFSLNLELLTFACFLDASYQSFLLRKTSLTNRVRFVAVFTLTLACAVYLVAGHIMVGV